MLPLKFVVFLQNKILRALRDWASHPPTDDTLHDYELMEISIPPKCFHGVVVEHREIRIHI
jgi:hypothetical protein